MNIKNKCFVTCLIFFILISSLSISSAIDAAPSISDREIIERLTRLEEGQKAILREMDKRFESIDKRFDQLINIFIGMVAAFAGIVAVTIGFAIWDRRTSMRPAVEKTEAIRMREEKLEEVIIEFAKVEPKMAKVLRSFGQFF